MSKYEVLFNSSRRLKTQLFDNILFYFDSNRYQKLFTDTQKCLVIKKQVKHEYYLV